MIAGDTKESKKDIKIKKTRHGVICAMY